MPKINKGVGNRIKRVRSDQSLSQTKFGAFLGITQRYMSMLEKGHRMPSWSLLKLICAVFEVEETWLRVGNGKKYLEKAI